MRVYVKVVSVLAFSKSNCLGLDKTCLGLGLGLGILENRLSWSRFWS